MLPHLGMEATYGIGGGSVSPESTRNLRIAEQWISKGDGNQALRYLKLALQDPANLDAEINFAFNFCPNRQEGLQRLERAEKRGRDILKGALSNTCFDDADEDAGHFWGILETRPYMRLMQSLVRLAYALKQYPKAVNYALEMMRLCHSDNMGMRSWVPSLLLSASRPADALSFIQNWIAKEQPPRGGINFTAPSNKIMPEAVVKEVAGWTDMPMLYGGALAAFKLWGDCDLARQFLDLGMKRNPWVMIKVFDRVKQPKDLDNSQMRGFGGRDRASARDYLFLSQHLWTAPDVWSWIDKPEIKGKLCRPCERDTCQKVEEKVNQYKRCAGCYEVRYCSPECQKGDWKAHKGPCKQTQKEKKSMEDMSKPPPVHF